MGKNGNIEDMALLEALRGGDEKAFDALFRKYYPLLCAYGHQFIDWEDAENIAQEILLKMWERREDRMVEHSLNQYLYKMAYHQALNLITRKEIAGRAETMFQITYQSMSEEMNYDRIMELTEKIEEAVELLPESYRIAFVMHRFKGVSYKQIAEWLHVSPKTVDYRIQQALKLLRKQLKDYMPVGMLFALKLLESFTRF